MIKKIILCLLISLLFIKPADASFCKPCTECGLNTYGGAIIPSSAEETLKAARDRYENVKTTLQKYKNKVTGYIAKAKDFVSKNMPFKKNDLYESKQEEKKDNSTQYNASSPDESIIDRMVKNMNAAEIERKGGEKYENLAVKRRQYLRQQATIQLMARTMVLKSALTKIDKIVGDIDKKTESDRDKSTSQSNLEGEQNVPAATKTTGELQIAWLQLLALQKQIEAIRLEHKSNIALITMKAPKMKPQASSSAEK